MSNIPAELTDRPQWVCWRYETRGDKTTKAPINAKSNGKLIHAKTNEPATWASHAEAVAACERHPELAGVGFCFAPDDGLTGIDLDHVIDPDTGELKPEAAEILERFQGTYAEVSPSGTGLRLFAFGKPGRSGKNAGPVKWCEVYAHPSSRYLTVTGNHWPGSATTVTEQQVALDWLHARFMTASTGGGEQAGSLPVDAKRPAFAPLNMDDAAILGKASKATNGADFNRLWSGDTSANGDDDSAADLALCNLLAFWTHGDADRIDRLFRQSGLMRQKWNEVHYADGRTYGQATVDKAIAGCKEFYGDRHSVRSEPRVTDSTGGEPDDKDAPKQKPESIMAAELGSRFADRLRVHPTTREWLLLDDRTGLFKPCPDAAVERLVYGAVADEGLEKFTNNYVVGITRLLRHEIALDDQDDLDAQAEPRLQWADEFCQNRPDTCWLIDGHMPACSVGVLFGDAESWKTFLAIDIACCVATGREWRGKEVKQGNVLFIAGEGGFGLRARIQAWFDHHNEPMRNFAVSTVPLELCDPQNANELIADIRRFAGDRQFELIVLDTLSTHFGFGDENATVDMNKFRRAVLKLSKTTSAAVVIIHHPGHTNKDREKGAITLRQGIDWGYRVERVGEVTTITPTKMKDAPPPPPLSWTLKQVPLPWADAKGKPIDGAVLVPTETQEKVERGPFLNAKTTLALEALRMALLTHGMEDRGVVTVSEEEWRQAAYDAGIASSDAAQNARRMAFNRAREALLAAKRVECFEGRYWIPHPRTWGAQDRTQAECAAEIQRTPAQDRTNRSKNEQPQGVGEVGAIAAQWRNSDGAMATQISQRRDSDGEKPPLYAENAPRTDPHKTAHCAGLCGLDTPSATGAQPHTTAHTPIGVCGCAGGPCADVPHGGGIDSREVGGMAEWRNGDEPEPPVAPPPVEAAIPVADKVADFLTEELHHGRRYTANTLEQSGKTGLSRSRLRAALAALEVSGRVTPRDLPPELRQGGRKVYLHPLNFAEPRGEVAANTPQTDRQQTPTSPAPNLAAAYREKNGGEVDAAISSSNSTTSPANIGEVPAKWRSKGKPLDSSLKSPKSGSGGDDSAENDGMSDSDQRRYSAEPRGEVGEVPADAQPPEHSPDIPPDISSATQAESKGESIALANKAPDIARANQQPPAALSKRPAKPPVCQPSANYPFRYVTKCDRPTPIPNPSGWGDPIGCSNCGARWANGSSLAEPSSVAAHLSVVDEGLERWEVKS